MTDGAAIYAFDGHSVRRVLSALDLPRAVATFAGATSITALALDDYDRLLMLRTDGNVGEILIWDGTAPPTYFGPLPAGTVVAPRHLSALPAATVVLAANRGIFEVGGAETLRSYDAATLKMQPACAGDDYLSVSPAGTAFYYAGCPGSAIVAGPVGGGTLVDMTTRGFGAIQHFAAFEHDPTSGLVVLPDDGTGLYRVGPDRHARAVPTSPDLYTLIGVGGGPAFEKRRLVVSSTWRVFIVTPDSILKLDPVFGGAPSPGF